MFEGKEVMNFFVVLKFLIIWWFRVIFIQSFILLMLKMHSGKMYMSPSSSLWSIENRTRNRSKSCKCKAMFSWTRGNKLSRVVNCPGTEFVCVHTSPGQFYPRTVLSRDILGREFKIFSADDNYAFERNKYRFALCYFDTYHREHFVDTGHFHLFVVFTTAGAFGAHYFILGHMLRAFTWQNVASAKRVPLSPEASHSGLLLSRDNWELHVNASIVYN